MIGGAISGLPFALEGVSVGNIIMSMLSKIFLVAIFSSIYLLACVVAKQKLWLSLLLSFGIGMLMFTMIPIVSPLNSTIVNVLLSLVGSVMFGAGLGVASYYILKKTSLISMLILSGSYLYFHDHFVRTGDADSIFILFIAIAIISLSLSSDNSNWLHLSCFMFALAFLTKSWHAFMIVPIIFFYWLFTKAYKKVKWWQYITCFLCAVIPILIWALARYSFDGLKFFDGMLFYDLLERSASAIESHVGYPFYYTHQLIINAPQFICLVFFIIVIIKKIVKKEKLTDLDKLCLISFLSIFVIFAIAKTKLPWYIFPVCVPLSISGSIYAVEIFKDLANKKLAQQIFKYTSLVFIVLCMTASTVLVSR